MNQPLLIDSVLTILDWDFSDIRRAEKSSNIVVKAQGIITVYFGAESYCLDNYYQRSTLYTVGVNLSVACTAYYFCLLLIPKIKKEGAVNVKLGIFFCKYKLVYIWRCMQRFCVQLRHKDTLLNPLLQMMYVNYQMIVFK